MLGIMSTSKDDFDAAFEEVESEKGSKAEPQSETKDKATGLGSDSLFEDDDDNEPMDEPDFSQGSFLGRVKSSLRMLIAVTIGVVLLSGGAYLFWYEGAPVSQKEVFSSGGESSAKQGETQPRGKQGGLEIPTETVGETNDDVAPEVESPPEVEDDTISPVKIYVKAVRPPRSRAMLWVARSSEESTVIINFRKKTITQRIR